MIQFIILRFIEPWWFHYPVHPVLTLCSRSPNPGFIGAHHEPVKNSGPPIRNLSPPIFPCGGKYLNLITLAQMNLFKSPISPEWFHYRLCVCLCNGITTRAPLCRICIPNIFFSLPKQCCYTPGFFSLCTQTADVTIWYLHVPTPEICGTMLGLHFSGCFFFFFVLLAIFFQNHTETQRQVVETLLLEFFWTKFGFMKAFLLNSTLENLFQSTLQRFRLRLW